MIRAGRVLAVPVLLSGVTAALLAGAAPASASTDPGVWVNGAYESCLNTNSSGQVFGGGCAEPQPTLHWSADLVSGQPGAEGEVFRLRDVQTGACLTAESGGAVAATPCGAADTQSWYGDTILVNKGTGACLNAETGGTSLNLVTCDSTYGTDSQRWYPAQAGT